MQIGRRSNFGGAWDWQGQQGTPKGKGKGNGKGHGKGATSMGKVQGNCTRCCGDHHQTCCPCLTDGKPCKKCVKTGHAVDACVTKQTQADAKCACCGQSGHAKKDCTKKEEDCNKCGVKGHLEKVCWKKQAQETAAPTQAKVSILEANLQCLACGEYVVDEALKRCPRYRGRKSRWRWQLQS